MWHGTNTAGKFLIPDGPAWFAFSREAAENWVGWGGVADNRSEGPGRVHEYVTAAPVVVLDVFALDDWRNLSERMTGDPDCGTGILAAKGASVEAGWVGEEEIMLAAPHDVLLFVKKHLVEV